MSVGKISNVAKELNSSITKFAFAGKIVLSNGRWTNIYKPLIIPQTWERAPAWRTAITAFVAAVAVVTEFIVPAIVSAAYAAYPRGIYYGIDFDFYDDSF